MGTSARELFARVGPEGHEPRFAGTHATVRFDVRGAGSWLLRIDDGNYSIQEGSGNADLVVASDEEDFANVMEGRHNFITAALQNRLEASGDLGLLVKFQAVLRSRGHDREMASEVRS
jgi:putative sterol carrier protein